MGKNSLIKSTTQKKTDAKKTVETKKTPVKAEQSTKAKAVQQPKAAAKMKKVPEPESGAAGTPSPKKKQVSRKELIFKKFEPWIPEKVFHVAPADKRAELHAAEPVLRGVNEEELNRIQSILFRKFDFNTFTEKANRDASRVAETSVDTAGTKKGEDQMASKEKFRESATDARHGYEPPNDTGGDDPMKKFTMYAVAGFVLLIAVIVIASLSNHAKYYVKASHGAVEIWRGKFAPMGEELLISLPGAIPPESAKSLYTRSEALGIAFDYYIDKADLLLEVSGMPDFSSIKTYLEKALSFAVTADNQNMALSRLTSIDLMILLFKADAASGKRSLSGLESALGYLKQAASLDLDEKQQRLVNEKIETIKALMTATEKTPEQTPEVGP